MFRMFIFLQNTKAEPRIKTKGLFSDDIHFLFIILEINMNIFISPQPSGV